MAASRAICVYRAAGQSMNETILVVDDEPKIVKLARDYLEKSGFRVVTASDGITALAQARHERPDLVVLDLNLPGMDGLDVCRALRRASDVPIIMLTAHAEEADRLIGLELGADDYVTKPFSPRELVARVRAVLRRVHGGVRSPELVRATGPGDRPEHPSHLARGEPLQLTRIEFRLLAISGSEPGPDVYPRAVGRAAARGRLRRLRSQRGFARQKPAPEARSRPRWIRATSSRFTGSAIGSTTRCRLRPRRTGRHRMAAGARPGAWGARWPAPGRRQAPLGAPPRAALFALSPRRSASWRFWYWAGWPRWRFC